MNNTTKIYRIAALTLSLLALLLSLCLSVFAEEVEIIPGNEHEVDITTSEENSGYVYLGAEVPEGWGGVIDVSFHDIQTGRDQSITLSYLENEYHSGIWLRFGRYRVAAEIPDSDGMCLVSLKDPEQKVIEVKKGSKISLTISAEENPEFDFAPSEQGDDFVPPFEKDEEYQDLPSVAEKPTEDEEVLPTTSVTEAEEGEIVIEEEGSSWIVRLVLIAVLLIIVVAVIIFIFLVFKQSNMDD